MNNFLQYLLSLFTRDQLIEIGTIIGSAIFFSYFFNSFLFPRLRKRAARTQSAIQRMIFKSLKGEVIIWIISSAIILVFAVVNEALNIPKDWFNAVNIILVGIIVFSFLWFVKDLSDEIIRYYIRKGYIPQSSLVVNIIKFTVLVTILMIVLNFYKISLTSLITALGIGGLAIALALQDTLGNIVSGLSIITAGQIKDGDYIEVESGEAGYVRDITWRNTTIETLDEEMVIIPNSKLSNSTIINTNRPKQDLKLRINIGVDYDSDLDFVEEITLKIAKDIMNSVDGGYTDFEPKLLYSEFGDSSINFSVLMKVKHFDARRELNHHFIKAISREYRKHDINIPFPIRTLKIDDKTASRL